MRLTYREAQRIVTGLRRVDGHDDTKLSGEVRIKVGININRLLPNVRLFEKEISRINMQMANGSADNPPRLKELSDEMESISETAEDYKLKKFKIEDFDLKVNPKIKAETLSMMSPLIRNFDDGEGDED